MDIYEMAAALGDALKADERMVALETARKNYEADKQLGALVIEYEVQQKALENNAASEEPDSRLDEMIRDRLNELYAQISTNETYAALEEAQDAVNALMNKVNGIITAHITGKEPGCTHDCSTCGGCH